MIAPVIFLIARTDIKRNPIAAKSVSVLSKFPRLKKVASFETTIPPLLRPIKPIKSPTPQPIAILKLKGMLSNIHRLKLVMLMIKNKIPAIKTVPSATSHE